MKISFSPPFIDQHVIGEVLDCLKIRLDYIRTKGKELEAEVMNLTKSKSAVCVNSWTSGAIMMLKWFGVKEGDEVIIPAYSTVQQLYACYIVVPPLLWLTYLMISL